MKIHFTNNYEAIKFEGICKILQITKVALFKNLSVRCLKGVEEKLYFIYTKTYESYNIHKRIFLSLGVLVKRVQSFLCETFIHYSARQIFARIVKQCEQ